VVWERGVALELDAPPGASTEARDINNRGLIVGTSIDPTTNLPEAVIWKHGQIISLGTLPGDDFSAAIAVNNRGQVVGISGNAAQNPDPIVPKAFLWEDGVMHALGAPAGDSNASAVDINDRGQVVGTGTSATTLNTIATIFHRGTAVHLRDQGAIVSEALAINNRGQIVGSAFFGGPSSVAVIWIPRPSRPR
jgi:probable HAF family extracellular repeat protein